MNILFISRAYGEHAGGMERLSFGLINSFPNSKRIVHTVRPGESLSITRLRAILFVVSIIPRAIIASRNADIVHLGDPVLSVVGWCIARIRNIPIVVTVHGLDITYKNQLYQTYLKLFFGSFTYYVAISEYAKQLLARRGITTNVSVIIPGVDDAMHSVVYTRNDLGKLLYRNVIDRIVLVTTGRLVARKGHAWFIKHVLPKLPRKVLYAIAGDGPERGNIAATITSLKMEDRVLMLGRVSHKEKELLLNTCDVFIQPNIPVPGDAEGFGIAPVEAVLCGRAVFASNIEGIPSAIHDAKNGTLLPPKETTAWIDALTQYIQHSLSYEPSGKDARAYTKALCSWEVVTKQYTELFARLSA